LRLRRKAGRDDAVNGPGQPTVGEVEAVTDSDRRWAVKARELELEALPNIRFAAEKWATNLTGLLGVVGLAAVIEGANVFDGLRQPWQTVGQAAFFGAALIALVATGAAIWAATEATPKVFLPGGDILRATSRAAVENAVKRLALSRVLAGVAVSFVFVSAACLWWGEESKGRPKIVDATGTALCGPGSARAPKPPAGTDFALRCSR